MNNGRILSGAQGGQLEPLQLDFLESSFRDWAKAARSPSARVSRKRVLLIFLLIRYTGAKLSEVLGLRPADDMDLARNSVCYGKASASEGQSREVHISTSLSEELRELLSAVTAEEAAERVFAVDPAFVRRKFYERAEACGFAKQQGGPEMIRKARAVELMRNNLPLPAVQRLFGHSTPNLTASFVSFSEEDMRKLTRWYMERESGAKTSARNSFYGKVKSLDKGAIQSLVELSLPDGNTLWAMVTNTSAERLSIMPGMMLTAEIKAPWLIVEPCDRPGGSSAENQLSGVIVTLAPGGVTTECVVRLKDGTELCAVVSSVGLAALGIGEGDCARVLFSCHAVILRAE